MIYCCFFNEFIAEYLDFEPLLMLQAIANKKCVFCSCIVLDLLQMRVIL